MMREHCWIQLRHNNIFCRLNQHHRQFRFGFRFRWMLCLLILGCSIVVAHKHDDQNNNLLFIRRNNNKRAADSHHNDNNNNNNNPNLLLASTYPATSQEEVQIPWDAQITGISDRRKREPLFKYNKKMGRVNMDLGRPTSTVTTSSRRLILPKSTFSRNITTTTTATPGHSVSATTSGEDVLSISMDPFAAIRLIQVLSLASKSFMSAFLGTLRLLGPLIFTRRALVPLGELLSDYMMGRYLRQTYHKIDRQYWKHYEGPAATRALARAAIQMFVLMQVGRMMEWMVGLQQDPCHIDGLGTCHWWCGVLWLISTVGTGNIAVAMLSIILWPLRIKVTKRSGPIGGTVRRPKSETVLIRPWSALRWMKDPDKSISSIATARRAGGRPPKPFTPEPLLFPVTWTPFRVLRFFAVAKAMASSSDLVSNSMHVVMRLFLIEQALIDEWHRVLMEEKRVGLGVIAISLSFIATSFLFVTVALLDAVSAVLILPSLLATFASAWMNLFVYWDRKRDKFSNRQLVVRPTITETGRQKRPLGTPMYQIKW